MSDDTKVTIYYGPLSWFERQIGDAEREYLLDIVNEHDEAMRRFVHVAPGQESNVEAEPVERPERVVAESSDYASMQEHAIMNFVGLMRSINPKQLLLHNPPAPIHNQLEREFSPAVERYPYPAVTRDTLMRFRHDFSKHLVGQECVKDSMLAALYPLTTAKRTKPVVLMFYGPSGVGKTETAQFVNGLLGGTLLRKQFSMFHSDKFASYLFGGAHSEASFAHDLLDRESGVILIDEFDKANAVFHSAFYQLFDGGEFEDKNYRVRVGPSLIICTSNYNSENDIREALGDALYSRFDAVVPFAPLSKAEISEVIDRIVDERFARLEPDELKRLDINDVKLRLHPLVDEPGNVRKIGKLINEAISLILVRSILGEDGPTG